MKRIISTLLALTLLVAFAVPAFAATGFVDSIASKPAVDTKGETVVKDANGNVMDIKPEVSIIGISEVINSNPEAGTPEAVLKQAYQELKDGKANLPKSNLIIEHIMDVSVDAETTKALEGGATIDLTFNLGVEKSANVAIMTYNDGKWSEIAGVKNNGDGTVTGTFAHFCPVLFATYDASTPAANTGDNSSVILWTSVLVLATIGCGALVVSHRKNAAK